MNPSADVSERLPVAILQFGAADAAKPCRCGSKGKQTGSALTCAEVENFVLRIRGQPFLDQEEVGIGPNQI